DPVKTHPPGRTALNHSGAETSGGTTTRPRMIINQLPEPIPTLAALTAAAARDPTLSVRNNAET
ncbi:hypothetical protein SAMN05443582_1233, partial [Phyllobacterium sp. OV277]